MQLGNDTTNFHQEIPMCMCASTNKCMCGAYIYSSNEYAMGHTALPYNRECAGMQTKDISSLWISKVSNVG